MAASDEAPFTFSWLALRLLGRGLYSNPWSALSELVANGLDADAGTVYVYVDARSKASATVEVIDDGSGMSRADISNYVKVGFNKRDHARRIGDDSKSVKGRKGIGKLAALFLSRHFYLQTKHPEGGTIWELDARDGAVQDSDNPRLQSVGSAPRTANEGLWGGLRSGTRLTLLDVDLTGYGPQSMEALGSRLANQFLLPDRSLPRILLWVRTSRVDSRQYEAVVKSVAYGNLVEVAHNFAADSVVPTEMGSPPPVVKLPARMLAGGSYATTQTRTEFPTDLPEDEAWDDIKGHVDPASRTYEGVEYSLTGWIGVHATIDNSDAKINDERFTKNKYYNPAQIRVYVRGKLASDRLLGQLGITGTYANYVEGEISFDILDDDSLPDIATSNRQDFDETDNRITLLRALVRPIVRSLIQRRNTLASKVSALTAEEKARQDSTAKAQFVEQLELDFAHHTDIPQGASSELQLVIANKIQGDLAVKRDYRVFISHAKRDRAFARFIDEVLRSKGATTDEIFFTSRLGDVALALNVQALSEVIKDSIVNTNTLVFYLTSKNFLRSEFCLFEGGAGWATRSVSEYLKLNMDYESIPKFLTNGKSEVTLLSAESTIDLTPELYNYLLEGIFNPMIAHLNRGRSVSGEPQVEALPLVEFPSALQMYRLGKVPADYFDKEISDHWEALVASDVAEYLSSY